jgi:broad specificity phosphatase PhoE
MGESPCFMNLFPPDEHLPSQQHETMTPARAVVVIRHGERLEQHETMKPARAVVVIRHGERLDWNMRDRGENWIPTADRPWDPPLTDQGREQANALGLALPKILETLNLPSIAAVYSSPFYRCRQTASELCASDDKLKVKVEVGLTESINLFWFQSWAMSGSDGTWGYGKDDCPDAHLLDPETLHPLSKQPVQPLLDWKQGGADPILENKMDLDYVSKTSVDTPYSLHPPKFEDINIPGQRMHHTLNQLSEFHPNETIVLVTHGTYQGNDRIETTSSKIQ